MRQKFRTAWIAVLLAAIVMFTMGDTALGAGQRQSDEELARYRNPQVAQKVISAEWVLIPKTVSIGDVVLVRSDKAGDVAWLGKTYKLQPYGAGYYTYVPIPRLLKPGKYQIGSQTLTVQAKKFKTQYLKVSKKMESMRRNTKRIAADQKKIDAARSRSKPAFLFTEAFMQPAKGRLSTSYGQTRYVNGKFDKSHMAIDIAAPTGTPVKAANDGIVVLADSLYLTGNSIYIDHGMELFSQYIHLSKMRVKAGQRVKRGDVIGTVGTTGFSTGPHLHFAFWAHNVQVNPNLFFGTTPFHWAK